MCVLRVIVRKTFTGTIVKEVIFTTLSLNWYGSRKNWTEQVRYNVVKQSEVEDKLDTQNVELKQQLIEILWFKLDEIMGVW